MGEVLEAVRTGPGGFRMSVALKRLAADHAVRGEAVQRFFTEARILARLDHPNIVRVHDVLAVDAGYFIVMELLRGTTLGELAMVDHSGGASSRSWPEVLAVADQALAGLAYAHAACDGDGRPLGLVHRDVTPRNIFVTDAGQVKLLDFGIAKLHEGLEAPITREGTVHGTLELLSPEQAAGESADASTDLYQLGAAMYWALAGRYPHGSGSAPELLARIIGSAPAPLAGLRPDVPAGVVALIERAMARERQARFASAAAMRDEVVALLTPTGVAAAELAAAVAAARAAMGATPDAGGDDSEGDTRAETTAGLTPTAGRASMVLAPTALAPSLPAAVPVAPAAGARRGRLLAGGVIVAGVAAAAALWLGRDRATSHATSNAALDAREIMLTLAAGDQQPMGGGLSRDGTRLVYATGVNLVVKPLAGGRAERLAPPPGFLPIDAEFAPDGQVVAYGQNGDGQWQVWRLGGAAPALLHGTAERFLARLSPDGRAVACARDQREVYLVEGGRMRRLVALGDGEMVSGMAWSPDSRRLVLVRTAPDGGDDSIDVIEVVAGSSRTVHRRRFGTYIALLIAWPHADSVLYAINDRLGAGLYSLDLATGVERPVHRWAGLTITGGRWSGGRLLYNRGTQRYGIFVADRGGPLRRLSTGDGQTRRLAGWSEQGWLFYANDAGGNLDIVAHPPGDPPALWMSGADDEMPDTLVDGAVIFQRGAGRTSMGLWRSSAPGDARLLAEVPAAGMAANAVRCAGDRRPPCVLETVDRGQVRYALFDAASGARGHEIAAIPARGYYMRSMAVSPDGRTLAVVRGGDSIALFDIDGGARRELAVAGLSDLQSVSWSADGRDLLVSAFGWRGRLFAALRVALDGTVRPIETSQQRWYWRPQESLDGTRVATVAVDFAIDLAMLDGL